MKILIADDHVLFREGVRLVIENSVDGPVEVYEAGSYDEALTLLSTEKDIELAVLDFWMPGATGYSGLEAIRAEAPSLRLIVMSVFEDPRDVRKVLGTGVNGYISKSASSSMVLDGVRRVLAGELYVSPTVRVAPTRPARDLTGPEQALTQRQREVLYKLQEGKSNKEIARELGLAEITVKLHVTAILRAFGAENRTQVVVRTSLSAVE